MWQTLFKLTKKKLFQTISVFSLFYHKTSVRTCVCAFTYGVYWFRSALNRNGRHQQSLVKLSNSIKLRTVCLPVAACETKHCCYHSHHDNHSAVSTRLGEMRCGKGIYNAGAYVIEGTVDNVVCFRRTKKLGCQLIYNSDRVEYLYYWMGVCVYNALNTCKTKTKALIRD